MKKQHKSDLIRKAFEEFADAHIGQELTNRQINEGVQHMLDFDVNDELRVSDFALPETSQSRSKYNKMLFRRIRRGEYTVLPKEERK